MSQPSRPMRAVVACLAATIMLLAAFAVVTVRQGTQLRAELQTFHASSVQADTRTLEILCTLIAASPKKLEPLEQYCTGVLKPLK